MKNYALRAAMCLGAALLVGCGAESSDISVTLSPKPTSTSEKPAPAESTSPPAAVAPAKVGPAKVTPAAAAPRKAKREEAPAAKTSGPRVVKAWDFTTADAGLLKQWAFPGGKPELTPDGARYTPVAKGLHGPTLIKSDLNAAEITDIRVRISLTKGGTPGAFKYVQVFWARTSDVQEAGGKFAFSENRQVRLRPSSKTPNVWIGSVAGHKAWNGTIERLSVKAGLGDASAQDVAITASNIELIAKK